MKTADNLRARFPKLDELMDEAEDDVLAFTAFSKDHWPQLASTNPFERLNKEIRRTDIGLDARFDTFDVFAPAAVIEGAGGIVTDWAGKAIDLEWRGQILAAGGRSYARADHGGSRRWRGAVRGHDRVA